MTWAACAAAVTDPGGDGLESQARACDDNVAYFRGELASSVRWSNVFMLLGAAAAAIGSACAGFLSAPKQRKAAAVVGAVGAFITVLPKTLPDKDALTTRMMNAEKHRVFGTKVRNQLSFANEDESTNEAKKYASARFSDCASLDPSSAIPELPKSTGQWASLHAVGVQQQQGQQTADPSGSASAAKKPMPISTIPLAKPSSLVSGSVHPKPVEKPMRNFGSADAGF